MGLLSRLFFLHFFVLVSIANIELPVKHFRDGSKSSFIQAPYISTARDQTVKEIQEEITNSWPEGIITYYLDDKSYDSSIGVRIRSAMSVLEVAACIRFRVETIKPEGNNSWIHITNPNKKRQCVHETNVMDKGEIVLILGYDCLRQEELIHSLLHGIGFKDEVTHPHRDKYIRVLWDNIQPVYRQLYKIQPVETRCIVEYDPLSIMHFHDRAFSSNGKATIVPLESGLIISPSDSLSQLDKLRIQLYFGHECNKRKFSSLIETCKMSLKGENEVAPVKDDQGVTEEDLPDDQETSALHDTKENEKSNSDTEENIEPVNINENEEENETPDENNVSGRIKENVEETKNSEEKTVLEDIKKSEDEKVNPEEDIVSVNKEEKENVKHDDESENSTLNPATVLQGISSVPNDNSINEDTKNILTSSKKREEPGINLNYESSK